jgi:fatty aldehyde decarbonylase
MRNEVYADILSQAISGELVGMQNYSSMVALYPGVEEQLQAVEHADHERRHAVAFRAAARDLGVGVIGDPSARYWARVREEFLRQARAGDLLACLIAQETMLESFAVATYRSVADVAPGKLGAVFRAVASDEEEHLEHAIATLRGVFLAAPEEFESTAERVHCDVMTVLAEMIATRDSAGPCGLCPGGTCVKERLPTIGLSAPALRGAALQLYLRTLDQIGVRGDKSLRWVANLPT